MKTLKICVLLFVFASSVSAQLKVDSIGRVLISNPSVCVTPSPSGLEVHSSQRTNENLVFGTKSFVNGGCGEYTSVGILGATEGDPFIKSTIGLYGSTTISLYLPSVDGYYAGYFQGDVRATGALYGTLLSPTSISSGNVERISHQIYNDGDIPVSQKLEQVDLLQMHRKNQDGSIAANLKIDTDIEKETKQTRLSSTSYGLAADQLKEVYPELVYEDTKGNYSINYIEMVPLLVQSIKELSVEISKLKGENVETYKKVKPATTSIGDIKDGMDIVRMEQNKPNPFSGSTVISLNIPEKTRQANIFIYDLSGKQIQNIPVNERGTTNITVYSNNLLDGMYIYSLVVDGKVEVTRRMIVSKI